MARSSTAVTATVTAGGRDSKNGLINGSVGGKPTEFVAVGAG